MGLVEGRGIGHALRTLLRGEGIDQQMRRADQSLRHGGSGLNGDQRVHQVLIDAATKLDQGFRQDKRGGGTMAWTSRMPQAYMTATSVRKR